MKAFGFIPARYASTRLPGKPLTDICGKPLLQRVYENAREAKSLDKVVIATDDERIAELCRKINAECLITPPELPSGTDRIAYAYGKINEKADIIVNIQGDEPLLTGNVIDKLVFEFSNSDADTGTLIKKITDYKELIDPGAVKVVTGCNNLALYFSRSTIPYVRDIESDKWLEKQVFRKHIGIYAYKPETLQAFISFPQGELEQAEKLEQLRLLQKGFSFLCVETDIELIGVDTPEDVEKVSKLIAK